MIFGQWVDSDYNTGGYYAMSNGNIVPNVTFKVKDPAGNNVTSSTLIISGTAYVHGA